MTFKVNVNMNAIIGAVVGGAIGGVAVKVYDKLHTPEKTIEKLETKTAEYKTAKVEAQAKQASASRELERLRNTKKEYQAEIRPEIEKKVRDELNEYIVKADDVYAKARHDREMADVKLELIKSYQRDPASQIHLSL